MGFTGEGSTVTIDRDEYKMLRRTEILWGIVKEALDNRQYVPGVLGCLDEEKIDLTSPPIVLEDLVSVPDVDMVHVDEIIRDAVSERQKRGTLYLDDCVLAAIEWLDGVGADNFDPEQQRRLATAAAYCLLGMSVVKDNDDDEDEWAEEVTSDSSL